MLIAIDLSERNGGQSLLQFLDACEKFGIVNVERSQNTYVGALVLRQPLDYRERPFYQLLLRASVSISSLSPPFLSSLSSPLSLPSASIRGLILIMRAREGKPSIGPRKHTE